MYKIKLNDNLIFDSAIEDDDYKVISGNANLTAGMAGSFTFTIPNCHKDYNNFHRLTDYIDLYREGSSDPLFSGRVYSIKENFYGQKTITCEGMMAVFNDTVFRPITHEGTLYNLINVLLANHNSQVEDAKKITRGRITIKDYTCYRAYEVIESTALRISDLVESFGGFIRVRKESGVLYFDWLESYDEYSNQVITIGENLVDYNTTLNSQDIATVVIPLGAIDEAGNRVTIKSVNKGLDYISASDGYIDRYGTIITTKTWDDVHEPSVLKRRGQDYLNSILTPVKSMNIRAVDLKYVQDDLVRFNVGQRLRLDMTPYGYTDDYKDNTSVVDRAIVDRAIVDRDNAGHWLNLNKLTLDIMNPVNDILEMGTTEVGSAGIAKIRSDSIKRSINALNATKVSSSTMTDAIQSATDIITGNNGGYIVMHDSDNDGYPDEILVMDTPSIATATRVWRWNKNGLAFSQTGYNGTYNFAMTMEGRIVTNCAKIANWNIDVDPLGHVSIFSDPYNTEFAGCQARTMIMSSPEDTWIDDIEYPAAVFAVDAQQPSAGGTPSEEYYRIFYVDINGNTHTDISYATTFQQTSDRRAKDEIEPLTDSITYKLKPVKFRLKQDPYHKIHHGFIAQDVQEVADKDWGIVNGTDQLSLGYTELIADMVATIQSQNERITMLEKLMKEKE